MVSSVNNTYDYRLDGLEWVAPVTAATKSALDLIAIPEGKTAAGQVDDEPTTTYVWVGKEWVRFIGPTRDDHSKTIPEIKLNEVEVQKLNLQPDEVLLVKFTSDNSNTIDLQHIQTGLQNYFYNNRVLVLGLHPKDSLDLTVVKESEVPAASYCSDCNCGKKEASENQE
jgi:hypothetical protein